MAACVNSPKVDNTDNAPSTEKGAVKLNVATRTTEGEAHRDYILSIYKHEGDKQTIVRKYDSSNEEMLLPERIWLLAGSYSASVVSGEAVAATFDETKQYFIGEEEFDVVAGESTTVDVVAVMQNVPVEVAFDQTVVDGFLSGYNVEVKASNSVKLTYTESKKGYFIMPEGYTTLSWRFVGTFQYPDGEQVSVDKSGTLENVAPKKGYKLSFKYSKDANGFLGGLDVVVDESTDDRDDHFGFNPDPEITGSDFDINARHIYAGGERKYLATSIADFCGVTLSACGKSYDAVASTVPGVKVEGLNTTQLAVTLSEDFFYLVDGGDQIIELCVTDVSGGESRKDLPYTLSGVNAYNNSNEKLSWAGGTTTLAATVYGTPSIVEIIYREGDAEWKHYTASTNGGNTYEAQIDGLAANHTYDYSLVINGKNAGGIRQFTTRDGNQIPNGNLEDWCQDGNVIIPWANGTNPYWCTGNYGTTTLGSSYNITKSSSDVRPGSKGRKSMYMDSEYIVAKFAAGNGYIGSWGGMNGLNAMVYFGQPFEYNAKPKAIRFWAKWNCGTIDKTSGNVGKSGDPDLCKIFCCMATNTHLVDSSDGEGTTFSPSDANIKSGDARYNIVLYSAYFETTTSQTEWRQVEIPFTFYGSDPNQVPTHLILTFTCSGYGDFFDGSTSSWMYVDDIEFVY